MSNTSAVMFLPYWESLVIGSQTLTLPDYNAISKTPLLCSSVLAPHCGNSGDELFTAAQSNVGIYDGEVKSPFQNGTVALTSHRLFFFFNHSNNALSVFFLTLGQIIPESVSLYNGFGTWSHPKITLQVLPASQSGEIRVYKLSFRGGGIDTFADALKTCLARKMWLRNLHTQNKAPSRGGGGGAASLTPVDELGSTTDGLENANPPGETKNSNALHDVLGFTDRAGIGGLQRTQHIDATSTEVIASSALLDVESVLSHTTALVQDIKRLRGLLSGSASSPASQNTQRSEATLSAEDMDKLISVEEALGIHVTGSSSSHIGLAQQMLAWLSHPANALVLSQRCFIPLMEFYALFNKKGGRNSTFSYVSPDSFLRSAMALEELAGANGVYCIRQFRCGLKALRCAPDSSLIQLLEGLMGPQPRSWVQWNSARRNLSKSLYKSVDASTLSVALQIDLAMAQELLEDLELDETLCRDEVGAAYSNICNFSWNYFLLR